MPLYVVATPLCNLQDLSPRARELLAGADLIVSEDTRVTRRLLSALGIRGVELTSCNGHNEARLAPPLADRVAQGQKVAVVSDAGTPCVADPGLHLVRACHQRGLPVIGVPGPSAMATALSVSGLAPVPFHFWGFSPHKAGPLRDWLLQRAAQPGTFMFFEGPARAARTARILAEILPEREVCLCRELSKIYEEVRLGPAAEIATLLAERGHILGEITFLVGPGPAPVLPTPVLEEDASLPKVAAALAQRWGQSRQRVYRALLDLERQLGES